jgi:hypothetical protein
MIKIKNCRGAEGRQGWPQDYANYYIEVLVPVRLLRG